MTQPSLNLTFDTSLIDLSVQRSVLNSSFSTTDTDPSESGEPAEPTPALESPDNTPTPEHLSSSENQALKSAPSAPVPSTATPNASRPTRHMDTTAVYDAWAPTYDTDGNILQAIDDLALESLLLDFLAQIPFPDPPATEPTRIVDFGCGTGRNTAKLLSHPYPPLTPIEIIGVDASARMLDIARAKLAKSAEAARGAGTDIRLRLSRHDILHRQDPDSSPDTLPTGAAAVLSTLVLEHIPLPAFFAALRAMLRPRGVALVTNMHEEMGRVTQAGFWGRDERGREVRFQGGSWVYGVQDVVGEAGRWGFEVLGSVWERRVEEGMVGGVLGERARKWVGVRVWMGVVVRRVG